MAKAKKLCDFCGRDFELRRRGSPGRFCRNGGQCRRAFWARARRKGALLQEEFLKPELEKILAQAQSKILDWVATKFGESKTDACEGGKKGSALI
jgi:hypothetical protein